MPMKESYSYKPFHFFLGALGGTWAIWFTAAYFSYQQSDFAKGLYSILELAGLFPPMAAALVLIFSSHSTELKQNFCERLFNLKLIKLSSIPALFLIMPAAAVISVALSHVFFGQSLDQLGFAKAASSTSGLIPIPVMFFGAPLLEELGWRGYGMDSLRGRRTFFVASLIFAGLWTCWHTPLFFIHNYYHNIVLTTNPLLALNCIVSIPPMGFIINWLWYKNKGSILTGVIFHAVANFVYGYLSMGQVAKCTMTVVLIVIAALIVRLDRKIFFEEFPAEIGYFGHDAPSPER
jgi:uncharacterized protein